MLKLTLNTRNAHQILSAPLCRYSTVYRASGWVCHGFTENIMSKWTQGTVTSEIATEKGECFPIFKELNWNLSAKKNRRQQIFLLSYVHLKQRGYVANKLKPFFFKQTCPVVRKRCSLPAWSFVLPWTNPTCFKTEPGKCGRTFKFQPSLRKGKKCVVTIFTSRHGVGSLITFDSLTSLVVIKLPARQYKCSIL